jgi:acetaldehyde dehydrogenase/alcohol dehydrogenase
MGAEFHLAHGLANALLLTNVIRYNANDNPTKQSAFSQYDRPKARCRYAEIADALGLGGETTVGKVEKLIEWIEGLKRDLEIPASIQAAGVGEAEFLARLDSVAVDAFDDQCTGANPRYPLIGELRAILLDSYYGRAFVETADRAPEVPGAPANEPALTHA